MGLPSVLGGNNGGGSAASIPGVQHVVIVVLENANFGDAHNPQNMPYLNGLLQRGALAGTYYADAHPSIPNYFEMTAGETFTFDDSFSGTMPDDNIVRKLNAAGKTWRVYAESLPSQAYLGGNQQPYLRRHNPFSFFSDVQNSPAQAANIVGFGQFGADVSSGTLPSYSFIVPNATDDAHDCPSGGSNCGLSTRLQRADAWLQTNIEPLLQSAGFQQNDLLVITFDESADDVANLGGHVMTVLVGAHVKVGFTGSAATYDHRSLLDLSLRSLGISDIPNGAGNAAHMSEFFQ